MKLHRVSIAGNTWQALVLDWRNQRAEYSENLEHYATASFPVLTELAWLRSAVETVIGNQHGLIWEYES